MGVHRDVSGEALARTLAVAKGIGGLRQGAIALTPRQEAVLDLAVEQVLSPALTHVNQTFVATMLAQGIPLEAVMTELMLSGEVERSYRLLREVGFAGQFGFHSPTSQYGQLSRRGATITSTSRPPMRRLADDIASGRFADEWDAESRAGHPKLAELRERFAGAAIREFEQALRRRLGPAVDAATTTNRRAAGCGRRGRQPEPSRSWRAVMRAGLVASLAARGQLRVRARAPGCGGPPAGEDGAIAAAPSSRSTPGIAWSRRSASRAIASARSAARPRCVRWAGDGARVVELDGRALLPGFIDAHGHYPGAGVYAFAADLNAPPIGGVRNLDDLVARLREQAAEKEPGEWVIGMSYDDTLLAEARHPTREDLDRVSTEHPVGVVHVSGHLAAVNGRGLEQLGIGARQRRPAGRPHPPRTGRRADRRARRDRDGSR